MKFFFITLLISMLSTAAYAGEWHNDRVRHDGVWRNYNVYVPDNAINSPIVVVLHGGPGTKEKIADQTKFHELADTENFIVVYPDAIKHSPINHQWNSGGDCSVEKWAGCEGQVDDLGFIDKMVDKVHQNYPTNGVAFATGISRGGHMVYNLACNSTRFSGFAAVAASLLVQDCQPPTQSTLYHIHGALDERVVFEGGGYQPWPPVLDGIDVLISNGWVVNWTMLENCGHEWPTLECGFDATTMIWTYFNSL